MKDEEFAKQRFPRFILQPFQSTYLNFLLRLTLKQFSWSCFPHRCWPKSPLSKNDGITLIGARHMTIANCNLAVGSDVMDIASWCKGARRFVYWARILPVIFSFRNRISFIQIWNKYKVYIQTFLRRLQSLKSLIFLKATPVEFIDSWRDCVNPVV